MGDAEGALAGLVALGAARADPGDHQEGHGAQADVAGVAGVAGGEAGVVQGGLAVAVAVAGVGDAVGAAAAGEGVGLREVGEGEVQRFGLVDAAGVVEGVAALADVAGAQAVGVGAVRAGLQLGEPGGDISEGLGGAVGVLSAGEQRFTEGDLDLRGGFAGGGGPGGAQVLAGLVGQAGAQGQGGAGEREPQATGSALAGRRAVPQLDEVAAQGDGEVDEAGVVGAHEAEAGVDAAGQAEGAQQAVAPLAAGERAAVAEATQRAGDALDLLAPAVGGGEALGDGGEGAVFVDEAVEVGAPGGLSRILSARRHGTIGIPEAARAEEWRARGACARARRLRRRIRSCKRH